MQPPWSAKGPRLASVESRAREPMRRATLLPIYLVLLAVVVGLALAVRSGLQARERPLAGRWAAEFRLDSIKSSFAGGRARPPAQEAAGQVDLRAGPTRYPRLNGVPW